MQRIVWQYGVRTHLRPCTNVETFEMHDRFALSPPPCNVYGVNMVMCAQKTCAHYKTLTDNHQFRSVYKYQRAADYHTAFGNN